MPLAEPRQRSWDRVGQLQSDYDELFIKNAYKTPSERAQQLEDLRLRAGELLHQRVHDLRIGSLPRAIDEGTRGARALDVDVRVDRGVRGGGGSGGSDAVRTGHQSMFSQLVRRRLEREAFNRRQRAAYSSRQRQRRSKKYEQFQQQLSLHEPCVRAFVREVLLLRSESLLRIHGWCWTASF